LSGWPLPSLVGLPCALDHSIGSIKLIGVTTRVPLASRTV
jgi:hypothetical protein